MKKLKRTGNYQARLNLVVCSFAVASLVGCGTPAGISASADLQKSTVRSVIGTSLIGTKGKTDRDQFAIDETVAGICGAGVWTQSECARHGI